MLHKISYSLTGKIRSIGNISIGRTKFFQKINNIGKIEITYDQFGKVLTIDGQECGYGGWFSPILSVGDIRVMWDRSTLVAIGNLELGYDRHGKIQSIGDLQVSYGLFGRMVEIITEREWELTYQQQIALTIILLEMQASEDATPN